jgi:S-formylglutathione hydrolase FrmB
VCAAVAGALLVALAPGTLGGAANGASAATPTPEPAPYYFSSDGTDTVQALSNVARMQLIAPMDTGWRPSTDPPLTDDKACPPSRCRDYRLPAVPGLRPARPVVRVLLPVGYATQPKVRYPVVYLFNGSLSPYYRWSRATMLTPMSRSMKAIFVMPEGGHGANAGYFSDWKDGSFTWETWHTEQLVPWVDRTFRTIRGARAAVGASMGAQGALTYAARHPGLFKAVLSISGLLDTSSLVQNGTDLQQLPDPVKEAADVTGPDLRRLWGDPVLDRSTWAEHNPVDQVAGLHGVSLFIAAGTGYPQYDPADAVHSGAVEENLWNQHRRFFLALAREGIPYQARISQGQLHDWPYFHAAMVWGLPKVIAAARR